MTVAINYALKLSQKRKISGNRNVFHLFLTVLHELGLDGEAPHGVEGVPGELHLVEDLAADLDHLVGGEVGLDQIGAVGHEVVHGRHVPPFLHPDEMLHGGETLLDAASRQELLHSHRVPQEDSDDLGNMLCDSQSVRMEDVISIPDGLVK